MNNRPCVQTTCKDRPMFPGPEYANQNGTQVHVGMGGGVTRENWAEYFNSGFDFSPAWGRYCKQAPRELQCPAVYFEGDRCFGSVRRKPGNHPIIDPFPSCNTLRRGAPCSDTYESRVDQVCSDCQVPEMFHPDAENPIRGCP